MFHPGLAERWRLIVFLILVGVGLALAAELTFIHYQVHTDAAFRSFCAINSQINCDSVAQSSYAVFWRLPVSVWGILGNLAMGFLAAWGLSRRRLHSRWPAGGLLMVSGCGVLVSVYLAVISKLYIHSLCILCMGVWLVSIALFWLAFTHARRSGGLRQAVLQDWRALRAKPLLFGALAAASLAVLTALAIFFPRYWEIENIIGPGELAHGIDEQGDPWIGAKEPRVTIVEYSDYECPYCPKAHQQLRQVLKTMPQEVRLVHRQFPLDQQCNPLITRPFHQSACQLAVMAICAQEQDRFWQMNDLLFFLQQRRPDNLDELAQRAGLDISRFRACLNAPQTSQRLSRDIDQGLRQGVNGTPSFTMNGVSFSGHVPVAEIRKAIDSSPPVKP